jgi:hypothetical protein
MGIKDKIRIYEAQDLAPGNQMIFAAFPKSCWRVFFKQPQTGGSRFVRDFFKTARFNRSSVTTPYWTLP